MSELFTGLTVPVFADLCVRVVMRDWAQSLQCKKKIFSMFIIPLLPTEVTALSSNSLLDHTKWDVSPVLLN